MASAKNATLGQLPEGFTPPFARIQMEERIDDAFACVAMLTGKTLAEVNKMAVTLGYPPFGPAWCTVDLISKLLFNLSNLQVSKDYLELPSLAALPDVAIIMVDYDSTSEIGRHILWHHVRGTDKHPSFHYVIDPAHWIDPKFHITTDLAHFKQLPSYYLEVKPRTNGKPK